MTSVFLVPLVVLQIALLALLIGWERKRASEEQLAELKEVAAAFYSQIMVARLWNAAHGGVYCEVSKETQPNPYLDDPEREIVTAEGRVYTKINPAYMTRQLSEIAGRREGYGFRLVSLKPLNPLNKPDEWEAEALRSFGRKILSEATTVMKTADGKRDFKYIAPLRIEEPCLRCHLKQGYKAGDIKGGVSVTISMEKSDARCSAKLKRTTMLLSLLGVFGALLTSSVTLYLSRRLYSQIGRSIEREKLSATLEMAGATAHEMRQPLTVVHSMIDLARSKTRDNEAVTDEELEMISSQCVRMDNVIKKMLNITMYRTKSYVGDEKIVDLDASAGLETEEELGSSSERRH